SRPVPVVVCSITHESGASALEALELGAVEFVQKPTALATDRVYEIADELVAKVKGAAAARAHVEQPRPPAPPAVATVPASDGARVSRRQAKDIDIVVIGVSTG